MKTNTLVACLITAVVVGGGAFYGGMRYQQTKGPGSGMGGNFQNLTPDQRSQRFAQFGGGRGGGAGGAAAGNNFASGQIISMDDKSITVKSTNGSTKTVYYSGTTSIMKSDSGTASDLGTGKTVTVTGQSNSDGSVTAQSIQIRPVSSPTPAT